MTDKEQITCKYKFQDKERFNGEPYCTCFCELCKDLPICDDNCQIYEDDKQLARKTQECESLKEDYKELEQRHNGAFQDFKRLKQEHEELKKYLKEIGINLGLNVDTGIIGEGAFEHWVVVSSSINYAIENLQQECEQKQNIIEEIEEYCKKCQILDLFGLASSERILDIINKKARKEE